MFYLLALLADFKTGDA